MKRREEVANVDQKKKRQMWEDLRNLSIKLEKLCQEMGTTRATVRSWFLVTSLTPDKANALADCLSEHAQRIEKFANRIRGLVDVKQKRWTPLGSRKK